MKGKEEGRYRFLDGDEGMEGENLQAREFMRREQVGEVRVKVLDVGHA
jgi:hypothetical protein